MPQGLEVVANETAVTIEASDVNLQALANQVVIEVTECGITTEFQSEQIGLKVEATASAPIVTAAEVQIVTVAEQGPSGIYASGPAYIHSQTSPSLSWVVAHNLNRHPLVDVQSGSEQVISRVTFPNNSAALVEFNTTTTGQALCF